MNSCYTEDRLYDYVDGVLGREDCEGLERHLQTCEPCAGAVAEMRGLLGQSSSLPKEIESESDLWQRITKRIRADERVVRASFGVSETSRKSLHAGWLVAIAAAVAVAALAIGLLVTDPSAAPVGASTSAMNVSPGTVLLAEYRSAGSRYDGAVEELIEVFDARRSELSPETVATVEESLAIIDKAIVEARSALEKDSSDPLAGRMYASMYQRKLDLLRMVGKLPREI